MKIYRSFVCIDRSRVAFETAFVYCDGFQCDSGGCSLQSFVGSGMFSIEFCSSLQRILLTYRNRFRQFWSIGKVSKILPLHRIPHNSTPARLRSLSTQHSSLNSYYKHESCCQTLSLGILIGTPILKVKIIFISHHLRNHLVSRSWSVGLTIFFERSEAYRKFHRWDSSLVMASTAFQNHVTWTDSKSSPERTEETSQDQHSFEVFTPTTCSFY